MLRSFFAEHSSHPTRNLWLRDLIFPSVNSPNLKTDSIAIGNEIVKLLNIKTNWN